MRPHGKRNPWPVDASSRATGSSAKRLLPRPPVEATATRYPRRRFEPDASADFFCPVHDINQRISYDYLAIIRLPGLSPIWARWLIKNARTRKHNKLASRSSGDSVASALFLAAGLGAVDRLWALFIFRPTDCMQISWGISDGR